MAHPFILMHRSSVLAELMATPGTLEHDHKQHILGLKLTRDQLTHMLIWLYTGACVCIKVVPMLVPSTAASSFLGSSGGRGLTSLVRGAVHGLLAGSPAYRLDCLCLCLLLPCIPPLPPARPAVGGRARREGAGRGHAAQPAGGGAHV